jgi:RimJ/RimL family protein N-acetyltransferase
MTHLSIFQKAKPQRSYGFVRRLQESDSEKLADHWNRLDKHDRRERFNGGIADGVLEIYLSRLFSVGSIIAGYIENGEIRGVAELRPTLRGTSRMAELAFSIEAEWKRNGIGTRLMRILLRDAGASGYLQIIFTTNPENAAMKALARKFGARMHFGEGEIFGTIAVPSARNPGGRDAHPWVVGHWASVHRISAGFIQIILASLRTRHY